MSALLSKRTCLGVRSAVPWQARQVRRPVFIVRAQMGSEQAVKHTQRAAALASVASVAGLWLASGNADAAAEQLQLASDDRVGIIATLFVPVLGWVAFNMFQPLLVQLDRMSEAVTNPVVPSKPARRTTSSKRSLSSVATALALGAASALLLAESACASAELTELATELASADSRAAILATLCAPTLLWVAFNIAQPALNSMDRSWLNASELVRGEDGEVSE